MYFLSFFTASIALAASASARPARRSSQQQLLFDCDVSKFVPTVPEGQTNVTVPSGEVPRFVTVGVGVQNYTCSAAGAFVSVGAVATMYDVSCLTNSAIFPKIQDIFFDATHNGGAQTILNAIIMDATIKIGDHFFINGTDGKLVPVFDFTHSLGDANEFVDLKKAGATPSPDSQGDVDWLQLSNVSGNLAKTVLRLSTNQGQPPVTKCMAGDNISVPYSAQYVFTQ